MMVMMMMMMVVVVEVIIVTKLPTWFTTIYVFRREIQLVLRGSRFGLLTFPWDRTETETASEIQLCWLAVKGLKTVAASVPGWVDLRREQRAAEWRLWSDCNGLTDSLFYKYLALPQAENDGWHFEIYVIQRLGGARSLRALQWLKRQSVMVRNLPSKLIHANNGV